MEVFLFPLLKENDMAKRCSECVYFVPFTESERKIIDIGSGRCHRFPRQIVNNTNIKMTLYMFPIVDENDWCGEFKSKKEINENI